MCPLLFGSFLFVVKRKTFILLGINIESLNFVVDKFYMASCCPQNLLAVRIRAFDDVNFAG